MMELSVSGRRWGWVLLFLLATVAAVGYWRGRAARSRESLSIASHQLDLGSVWACDTSERVLPIKNGSPHSINVLAVETSCGCLSVSPTSFVLAPHTMEPIKLVMDMVTRTDTFRDSLSTPFKVELTAVYQVAGGPTIVKSWGVHGIARSPCKFSDLILDFGNDICVGEVPPPRRVAISLGTGVTQFKVEPADDVLALETRSIPASDADLELIVAPDSPRAVGKWETTIHTSAQVEGLQVPGPTIRVFGYATAAVQAIPARVEFGPMKTGDVSREQVILRDCSRGDLRVVSIEVDGAGLSAHCVEGNVLEVKQQCCEIGRNDGCVIVAAERSETHEGNVKLMIPVCYYGISR